MVDRLIAADAVTMRNIPVRKRISLNHIGRKRVIRLDELARSGDREPDPAIYSYNVFLAAWILKDDI